MRYWQAEPVLFHRAGCNRPKFHDVLRRQTEPGPLMIKGLGGSSDGTTHQVAMVKSPDENIGIQKAVHLPLVFAGIDTLSSDCLVRESREAGQAVEQLVEFLVPFFGADCAGLR